MTDITCPSCKAINQFYTEQKSNNLVARCSICQTFIKNMPTEKPTFHFGKYKGKQVDDIEDIGYLKWVLENIRSSAPFRAAIQKQISNFENLSR